MNIAWKNPFKAIPLRVCLLVFDAVLVNVGFLLAFFLRNGFPVPEHNFVPYRNTFPVLTISIILSLSFCNVYKARFKSTWELFEKVSSGLLLGTLFNIAFLYGFREKIGGFPTSVFAISFFINLFLIVKVNQHFLKAKKRIKKHVVVIGEGRVDDIITKKAMVKRVRIDQIAELMNSSNIDEIIISEKITDAKDLNFLLLIEQKDKCEILFSPLIYLELLHEKINGLSSTYSLTTFVGRNRELDEFFVKLLDMFVWIVLLPLLFPVMILIALLIKVSSKGPAIYKQQRVGKDGEIFTLYKFRTMVKDAEKISGFAPAINDDPRITKIGKWLRASRLDELPQLVNVMQGKMSLVGPRPENLYRVGQHKALQGIRLAVKPGLTGLAQIRGYYDLHPKHKIKYDFLYIQRKSFALNVYILLQTIPIVFLRKGW